MKCWYPTEALLTVYLQVLGLLPGTLHCNVNKPQHGHLPTFSVFIVNRPAVHVHSTTPVMYTQNTY